MVSEFEFSGESALTLDGKGRVTVPARHREVLNALETQKLIVTKHLSGCLLLMPQAEWEQLKLRLSGLGYAQEGIKRLYFGSKVEVEIDSASRVLITPELRRFAGLERDVMLVGVERRMELWDAVKFAELEQQSIAAAREAALTQNLVL